MRSKIRLINFSERYGVEKVVTNPDSAQLSDVDNDGDVLLLHKVRDILIS